MLVRRFVELAEEVQQVACGAQHTIVLTDTGRLYSTGRGEFGRLGRGKTEDRDGPNPSPLGVRSRSTLGEGGGGGDGMIVLDSPPPPHSLLPGAVLE